VPGLIAWRLGGMVIVLLLLTFAVFVIQAKLPADPVAVTLGGGATPQLVAEKRHELGYDKPLWVQYERYLRRLVQGDLGTSLRTRSSVAGDIAHFAPATAELALASAIWVFIFSLGLGIWSALRRYGSSFARVFMLAAASAPAFFLAILLILLFYSHLHWLPASGQSTSLEPVRKLTGFLLIDAIVHGNGHVLWDATKHLILPSLVIAIGPAVSIARVMRGTLIDVMRLDHIRTARSKGLSETRVLLKHALRNSLTPVLAMTGLQVGLLLTGVIVVETVFAWPGLGLYTASALQFDDFPAVMGVTLVFGVVYVVVNAAVDILQMVADPRLKELSP
jgi:peptide/nickel transport system permease protein